MAMQRTAFTGALWALLLAAGAAQARECEGRGELPALGAALGADDEGAALGADDECAAADAAAGVCALSALQIQGLRMRDHGEGGAGGASGAQEGEGCHNLVPSDGGRCWDEICWARDIGFKQHPDWYPGLDPKTSSIADWQAKIYGSPHSPCPRPCGTYVYPSTFGCDAATPAPLWAPAAGPSMQVKVLSYNLFWWHLFGQQGGAGDSAGRLIRDAGHEVPFDVMGFQECEDLEKVLEPVGLLKYYAALQGEHAVCMAYHKENWELLDHGLENVAEDMRSEFYGQRGAQWMRLKRKGTGETLLFVNHHGPLSVNSGGECGGKRTAHNLLNLMHAKGKTGDLIVLVGDFNANAASLTIQGLWTRLVHVYSGASFGGVDNVFSNAPRSSVVGTRNLGKGGSDHDAIEAVVATGTPLEASEKHRTSQGAEPNLAVSTLLGAGAPGDSWQLFWCGLIENGVRYTYENSDGYEGGGSHLAIFDIADPRLCCKKCQEDKRCASWVFSEWSNEARGPRCSTEDTSEMGSERGEVAF